jgi:hypothetical protein
MKSLFFFDRSPISALSLIVSFILLGSCSIPSKGIGFLSSPQHPYGHWKLPNLLSGGQGFESSDRKAGNTHGVDSMVLGKFYVISEMGQIDADISTFVYCAVVLRYMFRPSRGDHQVYSALVLELYFNMDPYCYNLFFILMANTTLLNISKKYTQKIL